jgi:endothelin-converting enzyme/putative endopeptidase
MDRWSRRWKAGEQAKDQLKDILEDVSKKTDWPKGSVEQLIGDFYGSCMDQAQINKLGLAPAEPMLKQIDAMKTQADLQRMIRQLHEMGAFVPFGVIAQPDNHQPSQTIAYIFASGLGLPDRDYYLKPEQRFQDARAKYLVHVANMFKLTGYDQTKAKTAADTVYALEKRLAENSLDNVALRDPKNTDHKTSFADLKKLAPAIDWDNYFKTEKISRADLNVAEPKFMQEVDRELRQTPMAGRPT